MLYHARERRLCLDGRQFGRGARPLVLLQGLNTRGIRGAALPLAWMYRMFAKEYTVYLFDRPAELPASVTVRQLAADTAAAMDALGVANADVLGVSQGGMIAQYLAIDRPDLVHRLVLAVTLARNNPTVEAVVHGWIDAALRGDAKWLVRDMAEKLYSDAYLKRYRPLLPLLTVLQAPRDVPRFTALAQACLTCSVYDELDKLRCPVLVIGGQQDRVVTAGASREIAQKLGCPLYLYEGLGHAAYEEAGDFNRRVYRFFMQD